MTSQQRPHGPTSVFIVAEIRLFRDGLAELLGSRRRLEVAGAASHHEEALPLLHELRPAMALVDVAQPAALETVRAIVDGAPEVKVIALAVPELEPEVVHWAEEGTAGYVPRDAGLAELEACVHSVARGEALYTPRMAAALLRRVAALAGERRPEPPRAKLTFREREIAALIRDGLSNKEIASALSIEASTVKNHVHNILAKLGVHRRAEAVARLGPLPLARAHRAGVQTAAHGDVAEI
jgi:two-component system, NarL family, nitrate/nitrite response regulator NarL